MSPESLQQLEKKLWEAAENMRANSGLKSYEYSVPVLRLIFLKFADNKFQEAKELLQEKLKNSRRGNTLTPERFQAEGVMFLPDESQYSFFKRSSRKRKYREENK